ncbi:MAG: polysaccharide pyruvyl transferase family protein [Leeuwenhoekiella sp.]
MESKSKKVGTLTLPLHSNYGGLLQAYALQRYLKERGHVVFVIDRQFNKKFTGPRVQLLKKTVFPSKWKREQEQKAISEKTDYFINKYIEPKTKSYFSSESMTSIVKEYELDALVVGSDQIWRLDYTNTMAKDYFQAFARNNSVQRLSYAASFGKEAWDQTEGLSNEIKSLIQNFDGVSVREDSGVEICNKNFHTEAKRHVDPTMLLKTEDYEQLAKAENESKKDGNILVYMLDIKEDRQRVINEVVNYKGGKIYSISKPVITSGMSLEEKKNPAVTSWIQGFIDAEYVVTDSFHGTVFSLLFNKPFIVYGNKERGLTRFYSMLKAVGLEDRIILSSKEFTPKLLHAKIDWEVVNAELEKERSRTDEYFEQLGL